MMSLHFRLSSELTGAIYMYTYTNINRVLIVRMYINIFYILYNYYQKNDESSLCSDVIIMQ